jgi:putative NADH-flavin reductase
MNVLIFGATGATGRLVVGRALEAGHCVTAFTRRPASVDRPHERLRVHGGDVLDSVAVESAVQGQDAVSSVYGVPFDPLHAITVYSEGTHVLGRERIERLADVPIGARRERSIGLATLKRNR